MLSFVVVALLALQGCTKHVSFAVLAPHQAMDDGNGCVRQCQMLHAGQTKNFLSCADTCPGTRIVKEKGCQEVAYDVNTYECTTAHAQTFDGVTFGLGIGFLVLLNVILAVALASRDTSSDAVK